MRRPGRYALRLVVVAGIIAAIIGIGAAWRASALASVVADGGGRGDRIGPPGFDRRNRGSATFSLSNADDLLGTLAIGGGVLAVVVTVDKMRRRRRPIGAAASRKATS